MITNICVLRSGGDFKPEHVQRLAKSVPSLVCLADCEIDGVKTIPLLYDWPSWWAKMEIFRLDIKGNLFYLDLDTTVIKMPVMPDADCVLRDFSDNNLIGSGLMYLTEQKRNHIWKVWTQDPDYHMQGNKRWPSWGDQGFLFPYLRNALRWQAFAKVYSYKLDCKNGIPDDAEVICYHGKPRPWDV